MAEAAPPIDFNHVPAQCATFYAKLDDPSHQVGDVVPLSFSMRLLDPGEQAARDALMHPVISDHIGRHWRFSWDDGGSYTLISDLAA